VVFGARLSDDPGWKEGAMIDQVKIGAFLRELRKEKNKTQEEIADVFRVSSRSVSRWENGNTLPDLGMLVELADYYNVDISEIIDGERKSEDMDVEAKESLQRVADYADRKTKQSVLHAITVAVILFALEMVCCGLTIAGGLMVLRSPPGTESWAYSFRSIGSLSVLRI